MKSLPTTPHHEYLQRKCALYTYICTYLFMLCYVCHLPELWKRGMAWLEPWKRGMARLKPWKRRVARLEPWEGGMARAKQWEKERDS